MPKNGRPPIPNHLKVLNGETRPSQLNSREPQPKPGVPDPPVTLNEDALAVWHRITPQLDRMGILGDIDQIVLGLLCQEVANHDRLAKLYENSSPLLADDRGKLRKNPLAQLLRDSTLLVARLAYEFGMTPSARAKLVAGNYDDESDLERLLS